jgi:hypothetical protein
MSEETIAEADADHNGDLPAPLSRPVREIPMGSITVPAERKRQQHRSALDQLKADILQLGLLHSIGIKPNSDGAGETFILIYGASRLTAKLELLNAGALADSTIAATIFPMDTPDWQCELLEISENLNRQELSSAERDAHTLLYAALLKAHGDVAPVNRSEAETSRVSGGHSAHDRTARKPTVVEKVADDLGVDKQTVHGRAARAAKSVGAKVSLENTDPETLIKVGKEAAAVAQRSKGGAAPDVKVAKVLLKMQKAGVLVGDIQGGVENWWREIHPNGQVVFTESESAA